MAIRLVILDIEGVLVPPGGSEHPWDLEDLLRIRSFFRKSPCAAILCSGRQEPYGEAMVQALNLFERLPEDVSRNVRRSGAPALLSWPSVFENGAVFYDPMAKRPFPHPALTPAVRQGLAQLRQEGIEPLLKETGAQLEVGKEYCLSINPPLSGSTGRRATTASFRPRVDLAVTPYLDLLEVNHSASAIDITPRGVDKASAVSLLLDWTGLKPDEVLGVADSPSDAGWLRLLGWNAAPANGRENLPGLRCYAAEDTTRGLIEILKCLSASDFEGLPSHT